jgi:hypothetical protein
VEDALTGELETQVQEIRTTRYGLTVREYAESLTPPVTPQAVRQWIGKGELRAETGADGHYRIALGTRRMRRREPTPPTHRDVT